ncbi:MAG: tRNA epoxyqueuosine(34) reductase QueG, partial [Deltaproteobacteria bacterium]|nr:tRNA epoxyqueuosine(34) reductase QueG [Deltaproteobacteria bacterium]
LGFIGKNACLIIPGLGSHVVLSTLVTSAPLPPGEPMAERCGECRACLDACPTDAFLGPRELDARRCVSYLTIEHEGAIDADLRRGVGRWFLGCDACQDVCPYNRGHLPEPDATSPYRADERWARLEASDILRMDEDAYLAFSEGSPARRLGREGAARNAALNLGNSGDARHLPVLRDATRDASEVVREAARWAIEEIGGRSASLRHSGPE